MKLDAIKQQLSSGTSQLMKSEGNKDISLMQSKLMTGRQSTTAVPGGSTTRRTLKLGKQLCYIDNVNYSSPTCLSSLRERDLY